MPCPRSCLAVVALLALGAASPAMAETGRLALFADGEDLATDGFLAPKLTRDGWEVRFESIHATLANIVAYQTEPPYDADSGAPIDGAVSVTLLEGPLTVDLVQVGDSGKVEIGETEAPAGFYNALAWDLVPGEEGASLRFTGTASRNGETVAFTLSTGDAVRHLCGEYVGDTREGFVTAGGEAGLDVTFHLDHLFGRADRPADNDMNQGALGFDRFADGGDQTFSLAGLHVGHVGEGHCHVDPL